VPGGQHGGQQRDTDGSQYQRRPYPVDQFRKTEYVGVDADKPLPQHRAERQAQQHAQRHDHHHQLQVVQADGPVVVAQGLERGDLLALCGNLAAQHHMEQKAGHGQEDAGQHRAQHALLLDFGVQDQVRHLQVTAVRTDAAIGREQAVQGVDHRALAGTGCQPHRHLVEGARHVVGGCQRLAVDPEHTKAALVGRATHTGENVLGRQANAHDQQRLPPTVHQR
jgi:hypothetical protein